MYSQLYNNKIAAHVLVTERKTTQQQPKTQAFTASHLVDGLRFIQKIECWSFRSDRRPAGLATGAINAIKLYRCWTRAT